MAVVYKGTKVVHGIPAEIKPIVGLPDGKRRFRFRNAHVGVVFVRTETTIEHFKLTDNGETWGVIAQGKNVRK